MQNTYTDRDEDTYVEVINRFRIMRREKADPQLAASMALNGLTLNPDDTYDTLVESYESVFTAKKRCDEQNALYEAHGWGRPFWVAVRQREEVTRRVGFF